MTIELEAQERTTCCGRKTTEERGIDRNPEDTNCTGLRRGRRGGNMRHSARVRASVCAQLGPLSRRAEFILGAPSKSAYKYREGTVGVSPSRPFCFLRANRRAPRGPRKRIYPAASKGTSRVVGRCVGNVTRKKICRPRIREDSSTSTFGALLESLKRILFSRFAAGTKSRISSPRRRKSRRLSALSLYFSYRS